MGGSDGSGFQTARTGMEMLPLKMNEIIARVTRGIASEEEGRALRIWRASSPANERHYRELVQILLEAEEIMWEAVAEAKPPSVDEILSHVGEPVLDGGPSALRTSLGTAPLRRRVPPLRRSFVMLAAAAGIATILLIGQSGRPPNPSTNSSVSLAPREVVTGVSETAIVRLGDGSVVRLAPESRLLIPDAASPEGTRQVWLTGRAFFAVTNSGDGRQFVVRSHAGDATVLGTRFDIHVGADDLQVVVVEGAVRLSPQSSATQEIEVGTNQRGLVSPQHAPVRDDLDDNTIEQELYWLGDYLVFEATPLRDVARELERKYGVPVRILAASLETETVRGVFLNESLENVVDVICRALSADCVTGGSGVMLGL